APGGGRIPAQPDHRLARLPGTGGRGPRRETQGTWDVRDRRSLEEAACQRTRPLPQRGVAAGARAHPAPRPGRKRPARTGKGRQPMNNTDARPVVSARGLRKAYRNKLALVDASFDIGAGRIVGLVGPNGAGKTT